jgi:hypothetical protein
MDPRLRRTFVIGGHADHVFGTIASKLAAYGLGVTDHHPMERSSSPTLPKNVEAVVVFNDMIAHVDRCDAAVRQARDAGIPVIRTVRKFSAMVRDLERAGLTVLPPIGTAPPPVRPKKRYVAHPPAYATPMDLPDVQWAESIDDARVLASVVWPAVSLFHVTDDAGYLVSAPKPALPAPTPTLSPQWARALEPTPMAANDKTFTIPMKPPEIARLEAALERFNLIRDISGQPVLSLDEFVVRLLGDGLSTQEAKFSRLAALAGKAA